MRPPGHPAAGPSPHARHEGGPAHTLPSLLAEHTWNSNTSGPVCEEILDVLVGAVHAMNGPAVVYLAKLYHHTTPQPAGRRILRYAAMYILQSSLAPGREKPLTLYGKRPATTHENEAPLFAMADSMAFAFSPEAQAQKEWLYLAATPGMCYHKERCLLWLLPLAGKFHLSTAMSLSGEVRLWRSSPAVMDAVAASPNTVVFSGHPLMDGAKARAARWGNRRHVLHAFLNAVIVRAVAPNKRSRHADADGLPLLLSDRRFMPAPSSSAALSSAAVPSSSASSSAPTAPATAPESLDVWRLWPRMVAGFL